MLATGYIEDKTFLFIFSFFPGPVGPSVLRYLYIHNINGVMYTVCEPIQETRNNKKILIEFVLLLTNIKFEEK